MVALCYGLSRERSNAPAYAREDKRPSFCVGVALCSLMALSDAESPIDFPMASARVCVWVRTEDGDRRDEARGGQISAVRREDG